ncbi:MAG: hypothetical protein AYL28_000160 [Candidatus Bathyarchaeota archaeon B23]|nr:MAG: hypothetical protein AYL28_000160 [Candidatus Bathyarchaeota archaeon B23]
MNPSFRDLLGRRTLILGDVGSGKTELTRRLLMEALELGYSGEVTVIDMAPEREVIGGISIGGLLLDAVGRRGIRYLAPSRVEKPRLKASSAEELRRLVRLNAERIRPLLEEYLSSSTPILFINDVSIYLQSGSLHPLLDVVERAETFIANGYYGEYLAEDRGTGISEVERRLMELLSSHMDVVVAL